jgi:hypothetical protein
MPFIEDNTFLIAPATSTSTLTSRLVDNNTLNPTAESTFTAYTAVAHEGPEFSCQYNKGSIITNIRPANNRPLLPAQIVVERTGNQASKIWSWLDGCKPCSAVDCSLISHSFGNIAPNIQVFNNNAGQLDSIAVFTRRRPLANSDPLPEGQTNLYQCYYI